MADSLSIFNPSLAAMDDNLDIILLEAQHTTALFPDNTSLTCTLTAAATADTFSGWTEIADSGTTTLSSKFTAEAGHISSIIIENLSQIDTIYILELSYGGDKTIISRSRFAGTTKFQNPSYQERFRGVGSPAGKTVYYRMKSATAVADTALVHFRYHIHS